MQEVKVGAYDVAYMGPYIYTMVHESVGYNAFARETGTLNGIIVVAKDSPIKKLEDLRFKSIAFPAPDSFAATHLPLDNLKKLRIPVTQQYVGSHLSVYLAVAKGLVPAGGGIIGTFNELKPEVRDKLRILWETPDYMPLPFAANARISKEVVDKLRAAMIAMSHDPKGRALLAGIGFKGIISANDSNYDNVRALIK